MSGTSRKCKYGVMKSGRALQTFFFSACLEIITCYEIWITIIPPHLKPVKTFCKWIEAEVKV